MKSLSLVSIILPVYNVEGYIKECLDSLVNQTYTPIEIIAVNDGSTDGSLSILASYAKHHTCISIITQNNKGLSCARNNGLDAARGTYILFVDSDDVVAPSLVQRCVEAFQKHNSEMLLFNHATFETSDGNLIQRTKNLKNGPTGITDFLNIATSLKSDTWYPVCWYAFRKYFLDKYNLRFYEGILHEDILFTPTALNFAKELTIVPEVLYHYRKRPGSITTDPQKAAQSLKDHWFIAHQLYELSQNTTDNERKSVLEKLVAKRYKFILEQCEKSHIGFPQNFYRDIVKSILSKRNITRQYSLEFYYKYLETPRQRSRRICFENLTKWPRRIYKFQIKPFFK